jgi:protein-L-isoaspartate(D-aspartate) O-methyltransferase
MQQSTLSSLDRRRNMVDCQLRTFDVTDTVVLDAFLAVPRERFVAQADEAVAYSDAPLVLREGQTGRGLLLPMVLARLLQAADLTANARVLDVGGATGYSAAILSKLAAQVVALESEAGFSAAAASNFAALGLTNVSTVTGPLNDGVKGQGPYDLILVNGAIEEGLGNLCAQLAPGGRLLVVKRAPGQVGLAGKATRFDRVGSDVSASYLFDAAAPLLQGFEVKPQFVF